MESVISLRIPTIEQNCVHLGTSAASYVITVKLTNTELNV
jgi:hypothetical protein